MRTPVANQIRKRRAVSDALGRHKVFVSSRLFRGDGQTVSRVLVAGQYYDVSDALLDRLMTGATPRELELEPAPEDAAR
ncbi:hypothetical protein SLT36_16130 [Aminobacter sp. BA135]|uniref:hypothetical protein n=1 Tax=Aminobacter sp. BA135 TaxID=537596 RepID=UPI003D7904E3